MENKIFWWILLALFAVLALIFLQPAVEERLAPELQRAWVAIEVGDSGIGEIGPIEIEQGTEFTLHAVVEAKDREGQPVYYTPATQLRLHGEDIAAERIRPWQRSRPVKVRWYTVEGRWPYLPLGAEKGLQDFGFKEFLRSDWPLTWSIPGEIDAANDDHFESSSALPKQIFGTQRYHVRVEIYHNDKQMVPEQTIRSWGMDDLKEQIDRFPTVFMVVPGSAAPASKVFGLTQLLPPEQIDATLAGQIAELANNHIAYSKLTVLRDMAEHAGLRFRDLGWQDIDLTGASRWQEHAQSGDLLRVGDRVVVLYEDRGDAGVVDYADLCLDFVQGAEVRPLSAVFSGEGFNIEIAALSPRD